MTSKHARRCMCLPCAYRRKMRKERRAHQKWRREVLRRLNEASYQASRAAWFALPQCVRDAKFEQWDREYELETGIRVPRPPSRNQQKPRLKLVRAGP